ncbi:MAG: LysR family transcriptional regulator, partial [Planctomycetia bacterium]
MNIQALRVFCEVARQRSFSRAASHIQITQSAASQAVQHLEEELGQRLVDRSHRPPQLTAAGDEFFACCRDILERLDQAIVQMRDLNNEVVGAVHVASIYSVGLYQSAAIRRYMELYPKASVRLQYLRPNLVVNAVLQGEATLGLVSYPRETRELAVTPWKEEEMALVCPVNHALADHDSVKLEDLRGEHFIAFDRDLVIRKRVDAALNKAKVDVQITMEFDNIETMKQAVEIGAGVSILPQATVRDSVLNGVLRSIPIKDAGLVRPVGIVHRKGKPLSVAAL